jgi:hypothetical protein
MIEDPNYYLRDCSCAVPYVLPVLAYLAGALVVIGAIGIVLWRKLMQTRPW